MNLAVSNIAWPRGEDARAAELMTAAGITAVELAPTMVWADPLSIPESNVVAYRRSWEARGIRIVALQALLFGRPDLQFFADDASRAALRVHLEGMARLGGQVGAEILVLGAPSNRRRGTLGLEEAHRLIVPVLQAAAEASHRHGVTLCVEPCPASTGCEYVCDSSEVVDLIGRVARPGFGLHLDSGAMSVAGEPLFNLTAFAQTLRHFHASEPDLAPLGTGGVPHADIAAALRSGGYARWISMEVRQTVQDPWTALKASIEILVRHYGP